jgi:hypothetical protein
MDMSEREPDFEAYLRRQLGQSAPSLDWTVLRQGMLQLAQLARVYYEALLAAGFTEGQALQIVMAHGCTPKLGGAGDEKR